MVSKWNQNRKGSTKSQTGHGDTHGVLEDNAFGGGYAQPPGPQQEEVGLGLAALHLGVVPARNNLRRGAPCTWPRAQLICHTDIGTECDLG
jgi:hypothetical protein